MDLIKNAINCGHLTSFCKIRSILINFASHEFLIKLHFPCSWGIPYRGIAGEVILLHSALESYRLGILLDMEIGVVRLALIVHLSLAVVDESGLERLAASQASLED